MSILDNVGHSGNADPNQEYEAKDDLFAMEFPGLYELLARIVVKGEKRAVAALVIKYSGGKASLCVTDHHTGSLGFHVDDSIQEALEALERRLQAGTVEWKEKKKGWRKD